MDVCGRLQRDRTLGHRLVRQILVRQILLRQ
jgi:hypothetical protein